MSREHVSPCVNRCGRPADGYFVCTWCTDELAETLVTVPWLLRQLQINETRAARYTDSLVSTDPTAEHALPYDPGASDVRDNLITALSTWARALEEHCHEQCDAHTPDELVWWIKARLQDLRIHPAAEEMHADLHRVVRRSYRVIDRPQGRIYVGPCGAETSDGVCRADLYAKADSHGTGRLDPRQGTVRCECGAEWDAEKRRDWLLDELRHTLATAHEIASAVGMLAGRQVSVKTIRTWAARGQIASHHPPGGGPARHPIGEVVDHATTRARG